MENNNRKTALRMIPYGLYILTAENKRGDIAAATVNWVTQTSFTPPLLVVGVKVDSGIHHAIEDTGAFALNILGKGQQSLAFKFFRPAVLENQMISGEPFHLGRTGSPILENTPAFIECNVVDTIEKGDHSIFVGEVVETGVMKQPENRPDEAVLWLKDLGENIFYGG